MESSDDRSIRDMMYCPPYFSEAGDECLERLPRFLPYCMEVGLHAMLLLSAG
jgi:hypothetical protein